MKNEEIFNPVDPYTIIAELNQKLKNAEKLILYFEIDTKMHYRADKMKNLHTYNYKHGTKFKFICEFMEKMYLACMSCKRIGVVIGIDKDAVRVTLSKMNVTMRKKGGANNVLFLHPDILSDIRDSKEQYYVLAKRHGISPPTVSRIRRYEGRWAKL